GGAWVLREGWPGGRGGAPADIAGSGEWGGAAAACAGLVPPANPAALAAQILVLLRDDALRGRLGACGGGFASRFDWTAVARTLEAHYLTLVGAGTAVGAHAFSR